MPIAVIFLNEPSLSEIPHHLLLFGRNGILLFAVQTGSHTWYNSTTLSNREIKEFSEHCSAPIKDLSVTSTQSREGTCFL